jgi:hypothetical protein
MGKRPQRAWTLISALALAAGVTAAATMASQTSSHGASRLAAAITQHPSKQDASVRASLLNYLREMGGAPIGLVSPGQPASSSIIRSQGAAPQPGITQGTNFEFSGYLDSGTPGTFSGISGTWQVPRTNCSKEQELNSVLVSLDGHDTSTIEAVGTIDYCFEGKAHYFTWSQVSPAASVVHSSTILPGDVVTATVTRTGTSYTMSLTDSTNPAQSFSVTQTCASCTASDAEWIAERPVLADGVAPLAPFHLHVSDAWQTSNGVTGGIAAGPDPSEVTMMDVTGTYPLDSVSDLHRNGSSFSVHFLDSY